MSQPPTQLRIPYLRFGVVVLTAVGVLSYLVSSVCVPQICTPAIARNVGILSVIVLVPIMVFGFRIRRLRYAAALRENPEARTTNARARKMQWAGALLSVIGFLFILIVAPHLRTSTPQTRAIVVLPAGVVMMIGFGLLGYARVIISRIALKAWLQPSVLGGKSAVGNIKFGALTFWIVIALLLVTFFNFAAKRSVANEAVDLFANVFPWILLVGVWVYFMMKIRRERERGATWPAQALFLLSDIKPLMWIEDALVVAAVLWVAFVWRFVGVSGASGTMLFGIPALLLLGAFGVNLLARYRPPT